MYKFILALLLTLSYTGAYAQKWTMIEESTDGTIRVLVDSESFRAVEQGKLITAIFRFVRNGVPQDLVVYVTETKSCNNRNGTLWHRDYSEAKKEWFTVNQYWWSKQGGKIFDTIGGVLCDILDVRIRELEKEEKSAPQQRAPGPNSRSL